jgi:hypothetical protein
LNIPCISKKKTKSEEEREGNFSSSESLARKSCDCIRKATKWIGVRNK